MMECDSGFQKYSVEVTGIRFPATLDDVRRVLTPLCGAHLVSISHTPRSGRATVELASRSAAEAALQQIRTVREIAFTPPGQPPRTLRANLLSVNVNGFTQVDGQQRWPFEDASAIDKMQQEQKNSADLEALFDRLKHGGMKGPIQAEVHQRHAQEGIVLKEMYLALGRPCELVFAGSRGQKDTHVVRSAEAVQQEHLDEFAALFAELPATARRTGIDATLHRISRSVHAIAKRTTAVTARVGRTIQGTVLPMLVEIVESGVALPVEELAHSCSKGLLLIGPPNVGKTTVLRELARLLSAGDARVVVIVDKSMEIAGTGIVPHEAIGNARVLTVEKPEEQDRVMIEAVENQSPDIVIVDELSTKEQCNAARTISGRGVAVIATVHGDGLASLLNDHERSLLVGGVASVTLSARESEARPDKLRQVSKRYGSAVFGAAVELRGYYDWIVHWDLEVAVDKYLDHAPFQASWRRREADELILAKPVVGCRQQGSSLGFAYALLAKGESIASTEGVNFQATDPTSGQRVWTEVRTNSKIYQRTQRTGQANGGGGFHFQANGAGAFQGGGRLGPFDQVD